MSADFPNAASRPHYKGAPRRLALPLGDTLLGLPVATAASAAGADAPLDDRQGRPKISRAGGFLLRLDVGNVNAAAAALRNWVVNLHKELDGTGIQAAHIAIDVALGGASIDPTLKAATPEAVSSVYWELHTTKRDQGEIVFKG
ncbi:hypothetical protein O1M63_17530 [Streptomyces mirabilis]|nr:hypothetical protein [Streptomyces mirabilis]